VRSFVVDDGGGDVAMVPIVPAVWFGRPIEVHGMATSSGRLSYAVRWHGERPALLWELEGDDAPGAVTLTAPGLDPSFRTTAPRGEALLAAPSTERPDEPHPSFG
jgi:hypothetical protein